MRDIVLSISIFLLISVNIRSQEKWTTYSNTDIITSFNIADSNLWIGTTGGLIRYGITDNTTEKITSVDGLGSNQISYMYRDSSENLWIANTHTLTKFDGKTFETFTSQDIFEEKWKEYKGAELSRQMHFMPIVGKEKDGSVWFKAGLGMSKYDGKTWVHRDLSSIIPQNHRGLFLDSKNRFWTCVRDEGIKVISDSDSNLFTVKDGLSDIDLNNFYEDSRGHIWATSHLQGLSRFDGKNWQSFHPSDNVTNYRRYALFEDKNGDIYYGTDKGFCVFDGSNWKVYEGSSDLWFLDFANDEQGNLWAATRNKIGKWNGNNWEFINYHPESILTSNWVITGTIDKNKKIWFGTGSGITTYDEKKWTKYSLLGDRVNEIICVENGDVWAAMEGGVGKYSNNSWQIYTVEDGLSHVYASSIAEDRHGNIWIGTYDGLCLFDGKTWKKFTTKEGLPHNTIWSIAIDLNGNILCATSNGISRYDGNSWQSITSPDFEFPKDECRISVDSNNNIWFGAITFGYRSWGQGWGIAKYEKEKWERFTTDNGLPDNFIYSMSFDKEDRIWVATENGGACVFKENKWQYFTTKDGLGDMYVRKIMVDDNGAIWFTTAGGISKLEGFNFYE